MGGGGDCLFNRVGGGGMFLVLRVFIWVIVYS